MYRDDWVISTRIGANEDPYPEFWEGPFEDFADANCDDESLVADVAALDVGGEVTGGGGASPPFVVRRIK